MLEVHETPTKIGLNELEYVLMNFSPSKSFLETLGDIVVDCELCNKNHGDKEGYGKVREDFKKLSEQTNPENNKRFSQYCLTLCYMCNHSNPRVYSLVKSLSQS